MKALTAPGVTFIVGKSSAPQRTRHDQWLSHEGILNSFGDITNVSGETRLFFEFTLKDTDYFYYQYLGPVTPDRAAAEVNFWYNVDWPLPNVNWLGEKFNTIHRPQIVNKWNQAQMDAWGDS